MKEFLINLGLSRNQHLIIHSSFRKIKNSFPGINAEDLINTIKDIIFENGSIIFPAFTYCFKKKDQTSEIFNRQKTQSKVGYLSEVFRISSNVVRTSSPTHSFSLWGNVTKFINENNSPESPLGKNSVLDWFSRQEESFIMLAGCDFSSLSLCHYFEVIFNVPYLNCFPWNYLNIQPIGVSNNGEQNLEQVPGCSKSFVNFENYLNSKNILPYRFNGDLKILFVPLKLIYDEAEIFFTKYFINLLCKERSCKACDTRWKFLRNNNYV